MTGEIAACDRCDFRVPITQWSLADPELHRAGAFHHPNCVLRFADPNTTHHVLNEA